MQQHFQNGNPIFRYLPTDFSNLIGFFSLQTLIERKAEHYKPDGHAGSFVMCCQVCQAKTNKQHITIP